VSEPPDDRCANGASAPRPDWECSSQTLSPFVQTKEGVSEGPVPRAGYRAAALFAERYIIRTSLAIALALIILSIAILASCLPAHAAGSGMPWESPLQRILESIEGPVAKVSAVIIIIVTGLSLAFGDVSGGFRKLVQVVFGLSIAFAATSFFLSFFSFAGGALIE
jgi:type IV secretion system protein TrbC